MPPSPETAIESLPAYIRGLAALGPRPAVIEQGLYRSREIGYGELLGKAFRFQQLLGERGVQAGARVVVWGPAGAGWAIAYYGCLLAGAVVVPIDVAFSPEFVRRAIEQSEAAALCAPAATPAPGAVTLVRFTFEQLAELVPAPPPTPHGPIAESTLAEIVYTSGATAEPKGVMITHGNLLANLRPVAHEIGKYKGRARWLLPLRFLHLIPLSHLFGQVMGLLIPPLIDSAVIYPAAQMPEAWTATIRARRASAMVCVPQQLQLMSQWALAQLGAGDAGAIVERSRGHGIAWRWWRWRRLHRRLGWKMWAFIVGGAALPPAQEELWNALGYAVIQGYGLTETAPAIAITHPFKIRRGAVGRKLAGVEIKLSDDGEILVRGKNVSPGYYRNPEATRQTFADGWLHTGDLGKFDEQGNLHYLGRKKEVIVTADGLNVYPEDVERALDREPEILESAVVEDNRDGGSRVHAVLAPAPGAGPEAIAAAVTRANAGLEPHQRIRSYSLWPHPPLPRTASTHKLQRVALAQWVQSDGRRAPPAGGEQDWRGWLQRRFGIQPERMRPQARLDTDLGLSSLDRVELMAWIETHTSSPAFDEAAVAAAVTLADLERLLGPPAAVEPRPGHQGTRPMAERPEAEPPAPRRAARLPQDTAWPLGGAIRRLRTVTRPALVFGPLRAVVTKLQAEGLENVDGLRRPVIFVANHQSLLDVPVILRALPRQLRSWLAPAMGADIVLTAHLDPHAGPLRRRFERWRYRLVRLVFNTFLLTEYGALSTSLRYAGEAADRGYCPLIFPEGARTRDGRMQRLRPGIGVFVANLGLPVVPIFLDGLFEILPIGARHARRGRARVRFGQPLHFDERPPEAITAALQHIYDGMPSAAAPPTPTPMP